MFYEDIGDAIAHGVPNEQLIVYWQNEFATANALVGEQITELVETWMRYNIPHSVMLVNLKVLERLVWEMVRAVMRPEQQSMMEESMKEIDLLVDILTQTSGASMDRIRKAFDSAKEKKEFDPMCR